MSTRPQRSLLTPEEYLEIERKAEFKSEYVLITQDAIRVEQYVRQSDRTWLYCEYQNPDEVVKLEGIGCELALKDVYAKVPNVLAQK